MLVSGVWCLVSNSQKMDLPSLPDQVWLVIASKLPDHGWGLREVNKHFRSLIETSHVGIDLCARGDANDALVAALLSRMTGLSSLTISPDEIGSFKTRKFSVLARNIHALPSLTSLKVRHGHAYSGQWKLNVQSLSCLERLVLPNGGMGLSENADFGAMPRLKKLGLNHWCRPAEDLLCLSVLTSLTLRHGFTKCVNALGGLTQLCSLNLTGHTHVSCISTLSSLVALTFLNLDSCKSLRSLNLLTSLSNLKRLSCINTGGGDRSSWHVFESAPVFTALSRLERLDLSLSRHLVPNLAALTCLTSLTKLWLDGTGPRHSLMPLSTLQTLCHLSLRGNIVLASRADDLMASVPHLVIDLRPDVDPELHNCGEDSWSGMRE